jgi:hypothetical protein
MELHDSRIACRRSEPQDSAGKVVVIPYVFQSADGYLKMGAALLRQLSPGSVQYGILNQKMSTF